MTKATYSVYVDGRKVAGGFTEQHKAYTKCQELASGGIAPSRISWRQEEEPRDSIGDMLTSCGY